MILVTGISWDLSSPESNSNNGVCDTHDEQRKAVHQYNDNNMITAKNGKKKPTHMLILHMELCIHYLLNHNRKFQRLFPHFFQVIISQICQYHVLAYYCHPNATSWFLSISDSYAKTLAALQCWFKLLPRFSLPRGSGWMPFFCLVIVELI